MSLFAHSENHVDLAGAQLARQAAASLAGLLAGRGMTRSDLAEAMRVSQGRVSQIMSGDANLTVRTLAAAAEALGAGVEIRFVAHPQSAGGRNQSRVGEHESGRTSDNNTPGPTTVDPNETA